MSSYNNPSSGLDGLGFRATRSVTAKRVIEFLQQFPPESIVYGYEGEDTGIGVETPDGGYAFISTVDGDTEHRGL